MRRFDYLFRKWQFLANVHTLALAELFACMNGETNSSDVGMAIQQAELLADAVPSTLSCYEAARQLICHFMPEYGAKSMPGYRAPHWLPEHVDSDWYPHEDSVEALIDGVWQVEKPEWRNLPGDKSADLDVLAALVSSPERTVAELSDATGMAIPAVRSALARLRDSVTKDDARPARWRPSESLLDEVRNPPKATKPILALVDDRHASPLARPDRPAGAGRRGELPKGLGKPLSIRIVDEIAATLTELPAQRHFQISATLSIPDDIARRYLHDLQKLGVVEQISINPMRWSLAFGWSDALGIALQTVVTDDSEPKRLARAERSAPGRADDAKRR